MPCSEYRLRGGRVVTPRGIMAPGEVVVRGEQVVEVGPARTATRAGTEVIDVDGCWVFPGLIDLHLHGGGGAEVMQATAESLRHVCRFHASRGTTGLLVATVSAPWEHLAEVVRAVDRVRREGTGGARLLGVHLEGPFLNPRYAGAHRQEWLRPPETSALAALLGVAPGVVRLVTLAPELSGAEEAVSLLRRAGVVVAAGHSAATLEEAERGYRWGVRHVTHLFNAMAPMHHREPGLVGFALRRQGMSFELIADGRHLHPAVVDLALRLGGFGRTVLVSDATAQCGLPAAVGEKDGGWQDGADGLARLPDGRLAGSLITVAEAVANVVRWFGLAPDKVVRLASTNPARVLGRARDLGALAPGRPADLVVLDAEYRVCLTMVGGKIVYAGPALGAIPDE